jgi:hypothetical protein
MKAEFPSVDQEKMVSPHAQEIEYALILSRIINTVKDDPSQLRQTIYEFARARLKIDTDWADESERKRLAAALETAIIGVEEFSARREQMDRLPQRASTAQVAPPPPISTSVGGGRGLTPAVQPGQQEILAPEQEYPYPDMPPLIEVPTRTLASTLARFSVGMLLFGFVVSAAYYKQRLPALGEALSTYAITKAAQRAPSGAPGADASEQTAFSVAIKTDAGGAGAVSFPLPSDYGVYALSGSSTLSELSLMPQRVPDKRIAMSAPVGEASRTTVADGKVRFIIFRRDLVGSAPDRVDIRVVARVARILTFDAKGKPTLSSVSDAWNIRNVSYEFRVRPIAGNPEMLLVQPEKADFVLPAGRYVLVLRDQGYDFTVAGEVTDLAQCLERTDAANGSFYSECLKF